MKTIRSCYRQNMNKFSGRNNLSNARPVHGYNTNINNTIKRHRICDLISTARRVWTGQNTRTGSMQTLPIIPDISETVVLGCILIYLRYKACFDITHVSKKINTSSSMLPKRYYQKDRGNRAIISCCLWTRRFTIASTAQICICEGDPPPPFIDLLST